MTKGRAAPYNITAIQPDATEKSLDLTQDTGVRKLLVAEQSFKVIFFAMVGLIAGPIRPIFAQSVETPTLHGTYSLIYSVHVQKSSKWLASMVSGSDQTGTITVSSDGNKLLYIMRFENRQNVVIFDERRQLTYSYISAGNDASIQPGLGLAYSMMSYIPFPAAGLDEFSFLSDVSCSNNEAACSGRLSCLHMTDIPSSLPSAFPNSPVNVTKWNGFRVVKGCEVFMPPSQICPSGGILQKWDFDNYTMFKGVPIARSINYSEKREQPYGQVKRFLVFGHIRRTRAISLVDDGNLTYKLISASSQPFESKSYMLDTYLTTADSVSDDAASPSTSYWFDPKVGSLDDQRRAALRKAAVEQSNTEQGTGPDRTGTGVFADLQYFSVRLAWYFGAQLGERQRRSLFTDVGIQEHSSPYYW